MQESLLNTVTKLKTVKKINVEELEVILNCDVERIVALCKKACVKPKTDSNGNAYFTLEDVNVLKKMRELYTQTPQKAINSAIETKANQKISLNPDKKINFLEKAKTRVKSETLAAMTPVHPVSQLVRKIDTLENSLIGKMSEILSEKMDGFDEIIVELIRTKTENENLRQQVNSLNKQLFILKGELASFKQLGFGIYMKKDTDSL